MADASKIEWCDATFNPWWGCAEVSPGCGHCYARTWSRFTKAKLQLWPEHGQAATEHAVMVTSAGYWRKPLQWARLAREGKLPDGTENVDGHRPRIFTASMADVFEDLTEISAPRVRLYDLILRTPELDWLVLTKRPEFARDWLSRPAVRAAIAYSYAHHFEEGDQAWDFAHAAIENGPRNVWMGTSIENARFTWRADVLREIPAAVRFISAEPLLGSLYDGRRNDSGEREMAVDAVDGRAVHGSAPDQGLPGVRGIDRAPDGGAQELRDGLRAAASLDNAHDRLRERPLPAPRQVGHRPLDLAGIDWVIIGGESGPGARPFHLEHAREIVQACIRRCTHCSHLWRSGYHASACALKGDRPAVFVKQLGAKPIGADTFIESGYHPPEHDRPLKLVDRKGGDMLEWPADLRIREFPRSAVLA